MRLRTARKIRNRWGELFALMDVVYHARWVLRDGRATAEAIGNVLGYKAEPPTLSAEQRRVVRRTLRKLRGKRQPRWDRLLRAYLRLAPEERTEWAVDMAIAHARAKMAEDKTWELSLARALPGVLKKLRLEGEHAA